MGCGFSAVLRALTIITGRVVVGLIAADVVVVVLTGCSLPFLVFLFCFLLVLFGLLVEMDMASVVVDVVVLGARVTAGMVAMIIKGGLSVAGVVFVVGGFVVVVAVAVGGSIVVVVSGVVVVIIAVDVVFGAVHVVVGAGVLVVVVVMTVVVTVGLTVVK